MIVADSDVLIDALRGREPASARISHEIRSGNLATTVVSAFELLSGARTKNSEMNKVQRLLHPLPRLLLDEEAGIVAAEIRRDLEAAGAGIGMADYLIAGICLTRSASLLTRNLRHFERIPGLSLIRMI